MDGGTFSTFQTLQFHGGKEAGFILFCAPQIWQKIGESVLGQSVAFLPGFLFILDRVMDAAGGEARLVVRAPGSSVLPGA